MTGQLWFPAEDYSPRLRTFTPLPGPCPDQFALKFGETAQNGQHQATMRRCRVSPGISKGFEAGSLFRNRAQQVEQIAGRPRQTIEPGDSQYVALHETCH